MTILAFVLLLIVNASLGFENQPAIFALMVGAGFLFIAVTSYFSRRRSTEGNSGSDGFDSFDSGSADSGSGDSGSSDSTSGDSGGSCDSSSSDGGCSSC